MLYTRIVASLVLLILSIYFVGPRYVTYFYTNDDDHEFHEVAFSHSKNKEVRKDKESVGMNSWGPIFKKS